MEIKLNKQLQKKLDSFLEIKNDKLNDFLKLLKFERFTFSKEEIHNIEECYKLDNKLREYISIYIGEAIIQIAGGFWSIGKFKKDSAYELPIILEWGKGNTPRICPNDWIYLIDNNSLRKPLAEMIYSL